jgi:hypothetical protein
MIGLIFIFIIVTHSPTAANSVFFESDYHYIYQTKVDSFRYHYKIVDSVLKRNPYDTSAALMHSITFMERLTGIKAHPDGDYIGWYAVTRMDLINWRKWYQKHKHEQR